MARGLLALFALGAAAVIVADARESREHEFVPPLAADPGHKWNMSNTTILFLKVTKVGGSTVGGVMRRIADHHGLKGVTWGKYTGIRGCAVPQVPAIWVRRH